MPGRLCPEGPDGPDVAGHRIVGHVAAYHAAQPPPLLRDGLVRRCLSWSLTSFSFARIRFEIVIRLTWKRPARIFPQCA